MRRALPALFVLAPLLGCERFEHPRYDGGSAGTTYVGGAGASEAPSSPPACTPNAGGAPTGATCAAASDCASTCCDCGAFVTPGASCVDGVCASPDVACAQACGGAAPPPTCGETYATASCDACMTSSCCADEETCASDPSCAALEACKASCADASCDADCESTYGTSAAADALDACQVSACSAECS